MSEQRQVVLAGDVGGTHARLALFEVAGGRPTLLTETVYPSGEFQGLEPIVLKFLVETEEKVDRGCLGVACPVEGGICHAANLGWDIQAEGFGEAVGIPQVSIINDFEAVGHGIPVLGPDDLETLQEGSPQERGPIALIGAGTGLGQGYLLWEQGGYAVHASEGGHADFAPADLTQWELLLHLRAKHGHVSWERVVSGHGLVAAYEFLRDRAYAPERKDVSSEIKNGDPAAVVSHHALAGNDPLSINAMEVFLRAFGAQAGNLALTLRTRGGVYLCGGIAPKILPRLKNGPFLEAFLDKGRLTELMEKIPVRVVVNESVGLWGAAVVAAGL